MSAARGFKPVTPLETEGGWHVEPDREDGYRWFVKHGGQKWALEGACTTSRSVTFHAVTPSPTRRQTPRSPGDRCHYWGISIYELDAERGPRLVRRMDGHEAEVMWPSHFRGRQEPRRASRDQTIAGWTLEGWDHQHELGGSFKSTGQQLVVEKVDLFSPAWEVGLAPDDRVMLLLLPAGEYYKAADCHLDMEKPTLHDGTVIYKPALKKAVSLEAALAYLKSPIPHQNIISSGKRRTNASRPHQRPCVSGRCGNFSPRATMNGCCSAGPDYYYDCSTHGDKFVGWHQNAETTARDQTPHFYPLEHYSERFHRPDKISEGLRAFDKDPKKAFTEAFAEIEAPRDAQGR